MNPYPNPPPNEQPVGLGAETHKPRGLCRDYVQHSREHFSEDARQLLYDNEHVVRVGCERNTNNFRHSTLGFIASRIRLSSPGVEPIDKRTLAATVEEGTAPKPVVGKCGS